MGDAGQGIDLALLAVPLENGPPVGADLRQDFTPQSLYYRLRDARSEAREIERAIDYGNADADPATLAQKWRTVRELAIKALGEQTKDLEIAAWLTESLVRSVGITGITAGATLIGELVEAFWESDLHPQPDEDGMETRVAPITGLNGQGTDGTLIQPLRKSILFLKSDGEPVTYWQYFQSEELEGISDAARRKQRLDAGVVVLEELAKAARSTGPAHFAGLRTEVRSALAAWTMMGERLDTHAGQDAPPTSRVRDQLQSILKIANAYAPPEADAPVEEDAAAADGSAAAGDGVAVSGAAAARPVTRDDMLRELGRIAEYFRRTEPHSPLAYTLEEAVRRGRLTWPELLEEVVPDGSLRNAILVMLGIRPPAPPA